MILSIMSTNEIIGIEDAVFTVLTTPGTGEYVGVNTYYGYFGSVEVAETE